MHPCTAASRCDPNDMKPFSTTPGAAHRRPSAPAQGVEHRRSSSPGGPRATWQDRPDQHGMIV